MGLKERLIIGFIFFAVSLTLILFFIKPTIIRSLLLAITAFCTILIINNKKSSKK